jgi:hypothetical protein
MEKNEIKSLLRNLLLQRNDVFLKEQDIQIYLAVQLINSNMFDNVYVEYRVPVNLIDGYIWANDYKVDIDILLEKEGEFMPIEIKYKTLETRIHKNLFGEINTTIVLPYDVAQNISSYSVWKDVKRNELIKSNFENVVDGISIFITNDSKYIIGPGINTQYYQFSLREGNNLDRIVWNNVTEEKLQKLPNFDLEEPYIVRWEELNNLSGGFKLLML